MFGGLGVGIARAWAFRDRRLEPSLLAALRGRDRTWVLDRYNRVVERNRVRAALLQSGCAVVEVVRDVSSEVSHGSWVLVDDKDRVVATAPAHAPRHGWMRCGRVRCALPTVRMRCSVMTKGKAGRVP